MQEIDMDKVTDIVMEKILVRMPEVIGNLLKNHAYMNKLNHQFYSDNPEFTKHKDVVMSVMEQIEGSDLTLKHEDILDKSIPIIKERIKVMNSLDTTAKLSNDFPLKIDFDDNDQNGLI